jgi:hypothetical protein
MFPQNRYRVGEATPPPAAAAVVNETPEGYDLVLDVTLTALQAKTDLALQVPSDADVIWFATKGESTGAYKLRYLLPNGRYTSSALERNTCKVGTGAFPVPEFPPRRLQASAVIKVEMTDTSNAENTIQLVLICQRMNRVG